MLKTYFDDNIFFFGPDGFLTEPQFSKKSCHFIQYCSLLIYCVFCHIVKEYNHFKHTVIMGIVNANSLYIYDVKHLVTVPNRHTFIYSQFKLLENMVHLK